MTLRQKLSLLLDGMAKGLFASLIVGVIIKQLGLYLDLPSVQAAGQTAQYLMGPCIGAGMALSLGCRQYALLSAVVAGALGAGTVSFADGLAVITIGEPVGALISAWVAIEIGNRLEGKTRFDLLCIPAVMIAAGALTGMLLSPIIASALKQLGMLINECTRLHPLFMGMLLGLTVGILLTLPVSSAALCIAIGIDGLAAGAALAGCCAQMVGFAAISWRDNKWGSLLALALGTSMLQIPNIVKNPYIWIPPSFAGIVCGALSTMVFDMKATAVGAGMGTSGLVGQFSTLTVMGSAAIVPMLILHFLLPALLSVLVAFCLIKAQKIRPGDLAL